MREKRKKKIVIAMMISLLLFMSVGYAAFSTSLNIKATGYLVGKWDVKITDVKLVAVNGEAENILTNYTDLTAYMEANLYNKGD